MSCLATTTTITVALLALSALPGACGCTMGEDADALLTSTREAVDAFAGSSVPAWMTLRAEQVQRISKLSDSVERSLLRCLSSR